MLGRVDLGLQRGLTWSWCGAMERLFIYKGVSSYILLVKAGLILDHECHG